MKDKYITFLARFYAQKCSVIKIKLYFFMHFNTLKMGFYPKKIVFSTQKQSIFSVLKEHLMNINTFSFKMFSDFSK